MLNHHQFESCEFVGLTDMQRVEYAWGVTCFTSGIPDWHMGNAAFVDTLRELSVEDIEVALDHITESQILTVQMAVSIPLPSNHDTYLLWRSLLTARGFSVEETWAVLMHWTPQTSFKKPFVKDAVNSFETRFLNEVAEISDSDTGASKYSKDEWLTKVRTCQIAKGPKYGCFVSSVDPESKKNVTLVSAHMIEGTKAASINWCGTNSDFLRKGHAKNALNRALEYLTTECGCEEVYLTAIEPGPIKLYESLGFVVVEECIEWAFQKI